VSFYTVRRGDTLWSIAADPLVYNDPHQWPWLFITNRERLTDPNNPNLIEPGLVLEVPIPGNSWLYDASRDRMVDSENPHLILPGMLLEIPGP
jgi:nucleoid-associated protein YgaU